jgi:hypothetical protein
MSTATFTFNEEAAGRLLNKIRAGLTPEYQDATVSRVAYVVMRRLVQQTPKKWTGQTRRYWQVKKEGSGNYTILNGSKVMRFLEEGTQAHGPVTAKALFIPLTRKAALAGVSGVMSNPKAFKFGRDYIFTKWVRGITASHMVKNYQPFANAALKAAMKISIRRLIRQP